MNSSEFQKCGSQRCKTCPQFKTQNTFHSSSFNNKFIFCHGNKIFSCKSNNIIYLITCSSCNKQYVGETTQPLHKRNNGHRSCITSKTKTFLYEHYNTGNCNYSEASIQIIDYIDNSSTDMKNDLQMLENYWIEKLGTAFPLGLNDKKKGTGNISLNAKVQYFKGRIKRYKRGRGKNKKRNRAVKSDEAIKADVERFKESLNGSDYNLIYNTLNTYRNRDLDALYNISQNKFGLIYNICTSFCMEFSNKFNHKETNDRESITFSFNCKFMDKLQLKSVIADTSINDLLPDLIKTRAPLRIFYKYNSPVSLKILNYGPFLKHLTIENIRNILDKECECSSSQYYYEPLDHIVTGDLNIVENAELRTLLSYGCKYREPINLPHNEIQQSLIEHIEHFITVKSRKYALREIEFQAWKNRMLEVLRNRINFFLMNRPNYFTPKESLLEKAETKRSLKRLKNKFIICNIDKASNNYAFVCKKLYVKKILDELGFDEDSLQSIGNETYRPCTEGEDFYVERISQYLEDSFNIKVEEENKRLARFFWNPKLHKNPYKARFIAGARFCATKPLNILVNSSLKLLKNKFHKYCDTIHNNSGINPFWSIDSSEKFLDKLRNCEVHNLQVYDFTTLYTKLELNEVEKMINEVIELIYSERNKYICIAKYDSSKCFFSKKLYNNHYCFDKEKLKEAVNFVIRNTYVIFGKKVFIQNKGIPMGGNSSSPIAELTVGKKEFNYIKKLMQEKKFNLAKILSNNCRYVDDLITVNYLYFHNLIREIYPPSLEMERSGENNKDVNYLDINIKIEDEGPNISTYNKTDDFNFNVVSLTTPQSNIPNEVGYNVFYSQILRYGNICSNLNNFLIPLRKTFRILLGRGYKYKKLINCIKKCFRKYDTIFRKFNIQEENVITLSLLS